MKGGPLYVVVRRVMRPDAPWTITERAVAVALADFLNREGRWAPFEEDIAAKAGTKERATRYALERLCGEANRTGPAVPAVFARRRRTVSIGGGRFRRRRYEYELLPEVVEPVESTRDSGTTCRNEPAPSAGSNGATGTTCRNEPAPSAALNRHHVPHKEETPKETPKGEGEFPPGFAEVLRAYPPSNHGDHGEAFAIWTQRGLEPRAPEIVEKIERCKRDGGKWRSRRDNGALGFVPMLAKFLRACDGDPSEFGPPLMCPNCGSLPVRPGTNLCAWCHNAEEREARERRDAEDKRMTEALLGDGSHATISAGP